MILYRTVNLLLALLTLVVLACNANEAGDESSTQRASDKLDHVKEALNGVLNEPKDPLSSCCDCSQKDNPLKKTKPSQQDTTNDLFIQRKSDKYQDVITITIPKNVHSSRIEEERVEVECPDEGERVVEGTEPESLTNEINQKNEKENDAKLNAADDLTASDESTLEEVEPQKEKTKYKETSRKVKSEKKRSKRSAKKDMATSKKKKMSRK